MGEDVYVICMEEVHHVKGILWCDGVCDKFAVMVCVCDKCEGELDLYD